MAVSSAFAFHRKFRILKKVLEKALRHHLEYKVKKQGVTPIKPIDGYRKLKTAGRSPFGGRSAVLLAFQR
jgi:hypothetical protein